MLISCTVGLEKRYSQSLENLAKAIPLCDQVVIFDNTEQFREIAGYEQGKMIFKCKDMTQWFKQNILQGLEKETKPIKATSISDRIAQKKVVIAQRESKKQFQEKRKTSEHDL